MTFVVLLAASLNAAEALLPRCGRGRGRSGFQDTVIVTLQQPTALAFAPDGRLFIAESERQGPDLRERRALLAEPFLDLNDLTSGRDVLRHLFTSAACSASRSTRASPTTLRLRLLHALQIAGESAAAGKQHLPVGEEPRRPRHRRRRRRRSCEPGRPARRHRLRRRQPQRRVARLRSARRQALRIDRRRRLEQHQGAEPRVA